MLAIIKSMSLRGLDGYIIDVQVDVSNGIPSWEVVGLPDISIKESKERVRTAIKNSNYELYSKRIVINLAPADIKKEGSFFDLPIAIGVLISSGQLKLNKIQKEFLENTVIIGELSLDGKINGVNGILAVCIEAKRLGIQKIIIPNSNLKEASIVCGIEIYGANNLNEIIEYIIGKTQLETCITEWKKSTKTTIDNSVNFSDVKGQNRAKRALEISAAGGHNCLLIGSPGSGKTMLARRIATILPDLTFDEALEITKIHSISGQLKAEEPIITERPFRSPHHTISPIALIGGGSNPKPGEVSLAHYGVLFLDELTEFKRGTLEVMRGPLEDKYISISRVNASLTYPCKFMLIASMNPCPCGYYGSPNKECTCTEDSIQKYIGKISGPLLDRIDIQIEVMPVEYKKLNEDKPESSEVIKARVNKARNKQLLRYKNEQIYSNSELTPKLIEKYCNIDNQSKHILEMAFNRLGLSARAYTRILKVARTIADLADSENIESTHIAEAIQYRSLDRKYFKGN